MDNKNVLPEEILLDQKIFSSQENLVDQKIFSVRSSRGGGGAGVKQITSRNSLGSQDFLTEILSYRGKMGLICVSGRKSLRPKEFLMARKSC